MGRSNFDVEVLARSIVDGLMMPEEADATFENSGFMFTERNIGGHVVRLDRDGEIDYLACPPEADADLAKYILTYDSPVLSDCDVEDWVRDPDTMVVTHTTTPFTKWIIDRFRQQGLDEAMFGVDHAVTVGQRVMQILFDIRLQE